MGNFAGLMNCLHSDWGITPSILFQIYYFGEYWCGKIPYFPNPKWNFWWIHGPIKSCWLILSFGILALLGATTWHQLVVFLWAFLLFVGCIFMTPFHYRILHTFIFLSVCFFAVLRLIGPFCFRLYRFCCIFSKGNTTTFSLVCSFH